MNKPNNRDGASSDCPPGDASIRSPEAKTTTAESVGENSGWVTEEPFLDLGLSHVAGDKIARLDSTTTLNPISASPVPVLPWVLAIAGLSLSILAFGLWSNARDLATSSVHRLVILENESQVELRSLRGELGKVRSELENSKSAETENGNLRLQLRQKDDLIVGLKSELEILRRASGLGKKGNLEKKE